MTLSAPTHLDPPRRHRRRAAPERTPTRRPSRPAAAQHILTVDFASPDGRTWQTIGGGDTLASAVAFARASCPEDAIWEPIRASDLYGD